MSEDHKDNDVLVEDASAVKKMYAQERFRDRVRRAEKLSRDLDHTPTVEDILNVSTLSYTGTKYLEDWLSNKIPFEPKKILDIGSGVGGPARYVAKKHSAEVHALEYLQELHEDAMELNQFCSEDLEKHQGKVEYHCGDFLHPEMEFSDFDAVYSQGVFLHIGDKHAIAKQIRNVLKPGGHFFIDDFIAVKERDAFTKEWLSHEYSVPSGELPFKYEYIRALEENGLQILEILDASKIYGDYAWSRCEKYLSGDPTTVKSYCDVPNALELFRMQIRTYNQVNFDEYPLTYKEYMHNNEQTKGGRVTGIMIFGRRFPTEIDFCQTEPFGKFYRFKLRL